MNALLFSKLVAEFSSTVFTACSNRAGRLNYVVCFEHVSSQWNCSVTTEPEANNYVTVNNTEGHWAALLPCRYQSAQIIHMKQELFPPILHLFGEMWHHTLQFLFYTADLPM